MNKRPSHRQALRQLVDRSIGTANSDAFKEQLVNARFNHNPSLDEALNSGDGTYKP